MPIPRPTQAVAPNAEKGPQAAHQPARPWGRRAGAFAVIGVAALIAAGCGRSASKTATSAVTAASTPATTAGNAAAPGTATITAKLTEFKISLSTTPVAPGTYTFDAVDAGHTVHALTISGPGVDNATTATLHPGQSAHLSVTLQAGKYDVFCPVGDHKQLGMDIELTIGGGGSSAAAPAVTATPTTVTPSGGSVGY